MFGQQVIPNGARPDHEAMPNPPPMSDAEAFAARLVHLLAVRGRSRHGAGGYLARKYEVSNVTANAWLNGGHRSDPETAKRIAEDHGTTFDWLYFGRGHPPGRQLARIDGTPVVPAILSNDKEIAESADGAYFQMLRQGAPRPVSTPATGGGYVRFQLMEGAGGMGAGQINEDYPEVIRHVEVAEWEVRRKIGYLPEPGRIALITGRGPSMRPQIDHGDVVMVDTSVERYAGDGVYVINLGGETQIKMLQMRIDGLYVVSRNEDYPAFKVEHPEDLHVGGRVVSVLGIREL